MNPKWLATYPPLSASFMAYGWFVAPYLIGAELEVVQEAGRYIGAHPPTNDSERASIEERIYQALNEPVFSPGYRARATWLGNQLDHFRDFNHLYEAAIFAYYKREYAPCVTCLLTALEGILLSHAGYVIGASASKPSLPDQIKAAATTPSPWGDAGMDAAHVMYRDTLVQFLSEWIYKNTTKANFTLSVLNRHYVLHGMDAGNFYRPQDVHRLILAFDLLIEFLMSKQRICYTFLPNLGVDTFLDERRSYYLALARGLPSVGASWTIERQLLSQHRRFVPPIHEPNIGESDAKAMALAASLHELAQRFKGN